MWSFSIMLCVIEKSFLSIYACSESISFPVKSVCVQEVSSTNAIIILVCVRSIVMLPMYRNKNCENSIVPGSIILLLFGALGYPTSLCTLWGWFMTTGVRVGMFYEDWSRSDILANRSLVAVGKHWHFFFFFGFPTVHQTVFWLKISQNRSGWDEITWHVPS